VARMSLWVRCITLPLLCVLAACGVRSALEVANGPGEDASVTQRPIEVLPETLPSGRAGRPYAKTLTATGGVGTPYAFVIATGALPDGLALTRTGELAGTPTRTGTYAFTVEASDPAGSKGSRAYTLIIAGPRWMSHFMFISTTSSRSAIALIDYTKPDSLPIYMSEDRANYPSFSPDGRLFSYTNGVGAGIVDAFIVNVEGETPGAPIPLVDSGHIASGRAIAWSPDSTRIAYTHTEGSTNTLWVAEVTDTGVGRRTMIATAHATRAVTWHPPDAIVFHDVAKRPNVVRFVGGAPVRTTFDLPDGNLAAISPDATRVLLFNMARGYVLGDVASGSITSLPALSDRWDTSPDFDVVLGRTLATGAFSLHDIVGTSVGPVRASGDGTSFYTSPVWGQARSLLVQSEHGRIAVTDYGPTMPTRSELPGAYSNPAAPVFSHDDSRLAFASSGAIWVSELNASSISSPLAFAIADGGRLSFAPSARLLLVEGGTPVKSRILDLERTMPPVVHDVTIGFDWSESTWSSDSTHIAFLGAKISSGRSLYLVDVNAPTAEPRLVARCIVTPAAPRCPGSVSFQP
jgi:hypothetical protein